MEERKHRNMEQTDSGQKGWRVQWWKEGEGTSQRTNMIELSMDMGYSVGIHCWSEGELGRGGQRGKTWGNSNRIIINKKY